MLTLVAVGAMAVLFNFLEQKDIVSQHPEAARLPETPPAPKLQVSPYADLGTLRAREDAVLQSYGWVDKGTGVVRIPIDRAMDLVAGREQKRRPSEQPR